MFIGNGFRWAASVALTAVVLAGCGGGETAPSTQSVAAEPIRVAANDVVLQDGTSEPKVVIELYEDFLCPACGRFESTFGPAVRELMLNGTAAIDYYMVAILDRASNQNYSSRASAAAYCVADADDSPDENGFQRFHAALYSKQPDETGSTFPTNEELTEVARQAGVSGDVPACIESGRNMALAKGLAAATGVTSTPTIRINGEEYEPSTPGELTDFVKQLAG